MALPLFYDQTARSPGWIPPRPFQMSLKNKEAMLPITIGISLVALQFSGGCRAPCVIFASHLKEEDINGSFLELKYIHSSLQSN
jgi:hypothetical protein